MINKFFDFNGYDLLDFLDIQYNDAVLKVDIGPFKRGQKLEAISVNFEKGTMEMFGEDGNSVTVNLELVIKD